MNKNLYSAEIKGELIYICQQVDNFAIASNTMVVADYIICIIDKHVSTSNKGVGTRYNGLNDLQTHDYIKIHCESYIDQILLSHSWTDLGPKEPNRHDMVPLLPDAVEQLQQLVGPLEGSKEHSELEAKLKLSYQGLLGELLYAFIIIHIKIGNVIQFLSKFSTNPHMDHYLAQKALC